MFVCNDCIEISQLDPGRTHDGKKLPYKLQCPACGSWWQQSGRKTIMFRRNRDGAWTRVRWSWIHFDLFTPVECQQRRCQAHATHKTSGKRKWKCDRHAGVCVVA